MEPIGSLYPWITETADMGSADTPPPPILYKLLQNKFGYLNSVYVIKNVLTSGL